MQITASGAGSPGRRTRLKTVGTWQVDDPDRLAMLRVGGAFLPLDRDTWIIADLLAEPRQRIKKRCFPAVWISDERKCPHARLGYGGFE